MSNFFSLQKESTTDESLQRAQENIDRLCKQIQKLMYENLTAAKNAIDAIASQVNNLPVTNIGFTKGIFITMVGSFTSGNTTSSSHGLGDTPKGFFVAWYIGSTTDLHVK